MLEILGMQKEAATLTMCLIVMGLAIGIGGGYTYVSGEKETLFGKILYWGCIAVSVIAFFWGALPGIALFFTFQWGTWIRGILFGLAAGGAAYGLICLCHRIWRRQKYAGNPLMKQIVRYCRENDIGAVLCLKDRVRFFGTVDYPEYCDSERDSVKTDTSDTYYSTCSSYRVPEVWSQAVNAPSFRGEMIFTQLGYDQLPDVKLFSSVLASKLGGCKVSEHYAEVTWYEEGRWEGNTKTNTNHIGVMYHDFYVFRRKYAAEARRLKREKAAAERRDQRKLEKEREERIKSGKTWE